MKRYRCAAWPMPIEDENGSFVKHADAEAKVQELERTLEADAAKRGLYGESHLVCQGGEHIYPKFVPILCQCGQSKLVYESPIPPADAKLLHHPGCDPGEGPKNYRCHPECKVV